MDYIDPHIHMVSRVTDDYERLARSGCVAVSEPAFWAGFDRGSAAAFADYFRQLTEYEPRRAAQFGVQHFCWLCINAKEAENVALSREVIALIPQFLDRPNVLGIGEIGLNKNTRNEVTIFTEQAALAADAGELVLVHTPHLEDKYLGTRMILDVLSRNTAMPPERVLIDHVEEHTIRPALEAGHWCAMTLYPVTKCTPARAADMIEVHGVERVMVNSAGDWGVSDPTAVPKFVAEMRRRGHDEETIRTVVYDNPVRFFAQCGRFRFTPRGVQPG
ncbi:MAG: metal-dependent hydrolase [Phycisphaerales bacterium]|nr:metal-dependent hydrolase [Phycisphaerales bacterium]